MKKNKKLKFCLSLIPFLVILVFLYLAFYTKESLYCLVGLIVPFATVWSTILYRDMVTYLNFRGYFSLKISIEEEMIDKVKSYLNQNGYEKAPRYKKAEVFIKEENRIINIIAFVLVKQSETDIFYSLYNKCAGMEEKTRNKRYNVVLVNCGGTKRKKDAFSYGGNVSKLGITILDFHFDEQKVYLDTGMITYNQHLRQYIKKVFNDVILFD